MKNKNCIRAFVKGNLGDDLFIHILCGRYPQERFVICGEKKYAKAFEGITNLTYISRDSFWNKWFFRLINIPIWVINKVYQVRGVKRECPYYRIFEHVSRHSKNNILISGSIFMELTDVPFVVNGYYRNEEKYYQLGPHVIGCNFGPYINDTFKEFYSRMFRKARYVCFREQKSYEMFDGENIHYAPDIVFTHIVQNQTTIIKDHVLLSVMNVEKDGQQNPKLREVYVREMVLLIEKLQKQGEKIILLGFCQEQKDDDVILNILEHLQNQTNVQSYCYPEIGYEDALQLIQGAKSVVATRYHAMILGWLYGCQVLPVIYSDKMLNVINDLAPDTGYVKVDELDGSGVVYKMFEKMREDACIWDVSDAVAKAQMNFQSLDRLFNNK